MTVVISSPGSRTRTERTWKETSRVQSSELNGHRARRERRSPRCFRFAYPPNDPTMPGQSSRPSRAGERRLRSGQAASRRHDGCGCLDRERNRYPTTGDERTLDDRGRQPETTSSVRCVHSIPRTTVVFLLICSRYTQYIILIVLAHVGSK